MDVTRSYMSRVRRYLLIGALMLAPMIIPAMTDAAGLVVTSADLPLGGSFFDTVTQESVSLSGTLHVITQVAFINNVGTLKRVEANVADSSGAGQTSGSVYKLTGADRLAPTDPCIPTYTTGNLLFTLTNIPGNPVIPGNPIHPPDPCDIPLVLKLAFDEGGNLLPNGLEGGSSVSIGVIDN